jgi:16S rRNA G1207 methylase RsmC
MNSVSVDTLEDPRPWSLAEQLAWTLSERVLANNIEPVSVLASSINRGQCAAKISHLTSDVTLFEFEHYRYRMLVQGLSNHPNVKVVCAADPPTDRTFQMGVLSTRRDWGAELTRDLLQWFLRQMSSEATFIVVVDHPDDQWLGDQLRELYKNVKRQTIAGDHDGQGATGYLLSVESSKLRWREFTCEFAFRDQGRLIQAVSRPGVFSHRRLDLGARRLMEAMVIGPNQKVIDIGCGSGVVAFTAALREPSASVIAIDSNSRAVECTNRGAALNGLQNRVVAYLSSDGSVPEDNSMGSFDVALANPPYFANFQIAELFLDAAQRALRPGGVVWVVGKQPDWYQINVPRWFDRVKVQSVGGGYCIATGIRPS